MIDWQRIEELKSDFGSEDFDEVVTLFLDEVEESFETLLAGNYSDLGNELHGLKGSAANLGFAVLKDACSAAEKDPQSADLAGLKTVFNDSRAIFLNQVRPAG
ncbi:MAG: Hpt domain-containing protein [Pseudomonadota bacterium]